MSEWIGVEERLPEVGEVVLIWPRDKEHPAAIFVGLHPEARFEVVCCRQLAFDVTHWMPLPPESKP